MAPQSQQTCSQQMQVLSMSGASRSHNRYNGKTWLRPSSQGMRAWCLFFIIVILSPINSVEAVAIQNGIVFDDTQTSNSASRRAVMHDESDLDWRRDDTTATTTTPPSSTTATGFVAATSSSSALPHPFDTNLGNNFTQTSCPIFFNSFLNDQSFQACMPFSLLLQTSNAFFAASRSSVQLTRTLDATCSVNYNTCSSLMAGLATQLKQTSNCGQDLQLQNPLVMQAYSGLSSYSTLYQAACLKDDIGGYCYADAVQNISAPSSYYVYYLPLGVQLPADTRPACNKCLQNTMSIFSTQAGNSSTLISSTYTNAAKLIDSSCGSTFVQTSSAASHLFTTSSGFLQLTALLLTMFWFAN